MGHHSKRLKNRLLTHGPDHGYCSICRNYAKLTREHVPPKGCGNVDRVVLASLVESQHRHSHSQGGLHYKTTCPECNNTRLGKWYDPYLNQLVEDINTILTFAFQKGYPLPEQVDFECNPQRVARSIVGHILAANAVEIVKDDEPHGEFDEKLMRYFLDEKAPLPDDIDIYYWYFPFNMIRVTKHFGAKIMSIDGHFGGHILKFFPLAFWISHKKPDNAEVNLDRLLPNKSTGLDEIVSIPLKFRSRPNLDFPELPPDDGITVLSSSQATFAKPKK